MRLPAEQFTSIRAFGAPAVVLALAAQGTFRGFKDTKTPLYAIGKFLFLFLIYNSMYHKKINKKTFASGHHSCRKLAKCNT